MNVVAKKDTTEVAIHAFLVDVQKLTVPKTRSAFRQPLSTAIVKMASARRILMIVSTSTSVKRWSAMIDLSASTPWEVTFVKSCTAQLLSPHTQHQVLRRQKQFLVLQQK